MENKVPKIGNSEEYATVMEQLEKDRICTFDLTENNTKMIIWEANKNHFGTVLTKKEVTMFIEQLKQIHNRMVN